LNSYNEAYAILTQNGIQIAGEPQYKKDLNWIIIVSFCCKKPKKYLFTIIEVWYPNLQFSFWYRFSVI
jgi:hypothetical protein